MCRRRLLHMFPILLLPALGCATPSSQPEACPKSIQEVLADPRLLREAGDAAVEDGDLEMAYRYVALLRTLHPESAEAQDLYPAAAKLFKRGYFRHRIKHPESVWVNSEPAFMFQWLASFFEEGGEKFPQEQVDLLFLGMPYNVWEEFERYAEGRRRLFAYWRLQATADDGRIESVTGTWQPGSGRAVSGASH